MDKYKVQVKVNLKPTIKDIKAITLKQTVESILNIENLSCKVGNIYDLSFEAENKDEAEKIVETICDEILSNSVIEEYEVIWQ